jgi:hypothetical protein
MAKHSIGDKVFVKYDIEQVGQIEKVTTQRFGQPIYTIRLWEGEYITDHVNGDIVNFLESDIFTN